MKRTGEVGYTPLMKIIKEPDCLKYLGASDVGWGWVGRVDP